MKVLDDAIVQSLRAFSKASWIYCPSIGNSRGILLVWNSRFGQKHDDYTRDFSMSVLVKDLQGGYEWVATSVYRSNNSSERAAFWAKLNFVVGKWGRPWVVGGDFNVTRFSG